MYQDLDICAYYANDLDEKYQKEPKMFKRDEFGELTQIDVSEEQERLR